MKALGKLFLLLSFVVVGRWSRPSVPTTVATFPQLMAPATPRVSGNSRVVLVRHNELTGPQRQANATSVLTLF